jgi:regulatory protein
MGAPPISLKGRALRLLSGREYPHLELERRLEKYEEEPGTLVKTLDELQAKDFISEQRVLESVVHRRAAKLGATRIKQELLAKGLNADAVTQAMQTLRATELDRARKVWIKKFGQPPADAAERGKQMRFLASRGFGAEAIHKVVSGGTDE